MKTKTWKATRGARLSAETGERVDRRIAAALDELTLRELRQELELVQVTQRGQPTMFSGDVPLRAGFRPKRTASVKRFTPGPPSPVQFSRS